MGGSTFDELLWCEECGEEKKKDCEVHGGYARIRDKAIPSRARLTAPHQVSIKQLELTADKSDVFGVFAKKVIQKRTLLGPYEGKLTEEWQHDRDDRIVLTLFFNKSDCKYLDCTDEMFCNWMMFVRPALVPEEQNLVAFQHQGCVYYATTRPIRVNEELKVWYAKSYVERLVASSVPLSRRQRPVSRAPTPPDSENEGVFKHSLILEPTQRRTRQTSARKRQAARASSHAEQVEKSSPVIESTSQDPPGVNEIVCTSQTAILDNSDTHSDNELHGFEASDRDTRPEVELLPGPVVMEAITGGSVCAADATAAVAEVSGQKVVRTTQLNSSALMDESVKAVSEQCDVISVSKQRPSVMKTRSKGEVEAIKKDKLPRTKSRRTTAKQNTQGDVVGNGSQPPSVVQNVSSLPEVGKTCESEENEGTESKQGKIIAPKSKVKAAHKTKPTVESKSPKKPRNESKPLSDETPSAETGTAHKAKRKRRGDRGSVEVKVEATKEALVCSQCDAIFPSPAQLEDHERRHTGELPFPCNEEGCDKRFRTAFKLKRHMTSHGKGNKFTCAYCGKVFRRKDHLKSHLRVHNPDKETYNCEECEKQYLSHNAYKLHVAFHRAEVGELTCYVCRKEFPNGTDLLRHLKVHAGSHAVKTESDKRHECHFCHKKFFTKKDMERHLVTHTKNREYMCHHCPARFGRPDHLSRHMKSAHSELSKKKRSRRSGLDAPEVTESRVLRPKKTQKSAQAFRQVTEDTEKKTPVGNLKLVKNDSNIIVYEYDGTEVRVKDSAVQDTGSTFSITTVANTDNILAVLQPAQNQLQQAAGHVTTLTNQKTVQIPSLVARETDLTFLQNPSYTLASDSDVSNFFEFFNSNQTNMKSNIGNQPAPEKAGTSGKLPVKPMKRQRVAKIPVTPRGPKRRRSSTRSSLTSQPTMSVDQLPGTSHLIGSPPQAKPASANTAVRTEGQSTNQIPINISYIDKINLEQLFGDKAKSMQKNVQLQLQKDLLSVTEKNMLATPGQTPQFPGQVIGQVISVNAPVVPSVHSSQQPAAQAATNQPPPLTTIDTQGLIQQLIDIEPIVVSSSQTETTTTVPMPQNVLLQLVEPNVNPNPGLQHPSLQALTVASKTEANLGNGMENAQGTQGNVQNVSEPANQPLVLTLPEALKFLFPNETATQGHQ